METNKAYGRCGEIQLSVIIATNNNLVVLQRALESWRRFAADQPLELIVVEDGCTDGTPEYLQRLSTTGWDGPPLRVAHENDTHELMCTNRGFREARGALVLSWHDDMFLRAGWFVPELLATFDAYPEIGLLSLSRGLLFHPSHEPMRTWEDTLDRRRMESWLGPRPLNWLGIYEVDGAIRPWLVRRECISRVGPLDEEFRPTEWDESDLCCRIRRAGWKVATHGYERDGAYVHQLSTTYARTPLPRRMEIGLTNARLFHMRWAEFIKAEENRTRQSWLRKASVNGWVETARQAARFATKRIYTA